MIKRKRKGKQFSFGICKIQGISFLVSGKPPKKIKKNKQSIYTCCVELEISNKLVRKYDDNKINYFVLTFAPVSDPLMMDD